MIRNRISSWNTSRLRPLRLALPLVVSPVCRVRVGSHRRGNRGRRSR